jgi:membrane-bound lytic murein transglycosylase D
MQVIKQLFCTLLLGFMTGFLMAKETVTDEIYQNRINALKLQLDITYSPFVKTFIEEYLENPELVKQLVIRSKQYFPFIEKQLRIKGVPADLKYLAATASQLDASATNATGATGMWMMAFQVSKMYKLKVTTYIDERRDVLKSTNTAAQHFKDLHSIYKNWSLAIAAYGCSPVMLNKCIRMANNSLLFWDIYPTMPVNCRDLLPKIIATAYILNYYKEHGIKINLVEPTFDADTVIINKWISFQQIANGLNISVEELRALNPIFKRDIIPFSQEGFYVRLPKGKAKDMANIKDSVYKPDASIAAIEFNPVEIKKDNTRNVSETISPTSEDIKKGKPATIQKVSITYVVKKGDVLGDIADWFDTTPAEIKQINKLKKNQVNVGQKLIIRVPGNKAAYYKRINTLNRAQKKKLKNKD